MKGANIIFIKKLKIHRRDYKHISILIITIIIFITSIISNRYSQEIIEDRDTRINILTQQISALEDYIQDSISEINDYQAKISSLEYQIYQLKERNAELESEKEYIAQQQNIVIKTNASSFKSYMDYRKINNKTSEAYKLQQSAKTDENGLRKIGEYYCVAMGTYFGNVGDILYIETDEGYSWKVILSDIKSDKHTDITHTYTKSNGCMMEFIVDTKVMAKSVKNSGTVNSLGFSGNITTVKHI